MRREQTSSQRKTLPSVKKEVLLGKHKSPRKGTVIQCHGKVFNSKRELASHYKLDRSTLEQRLRKGMSPEQAVDTPIRQQRKSRYSSSGDRLCVNCRQPITKTGNRWNQCIPCQRRYGAETRLGVPRGTYIFLWERQKGRCLCCDRSLRDVKDKRSPHIDHCHETGKVRGLLCASCNTALGLIEESQDRAYALASYIEHHCEPLRPEGS